MDFKKFRQNQCHAGGDSRQLVFWYGDDGSYEENIRDFQFAIGCKLWIVTQENWF